MDGTPATTAPFFADTLTASSPTPFYTRHLTDVPARRFDLAAEEVFLTLTYTSNRIAPYARDILGLPDGDDPGQPFRWLPERRELMRAELDAAMFHLYGLARPEIEHVLDSFLVVRKYEERDPPPGEGRRHDQPPTA